jgi:hypothetical protein
MKVTRGPNGVGVVRPEGASDEEEEEPKIDVRMTVQQGSFLPTLCLLQKKAIDASTYVIDGNTGAHVMHYTGHFGSVKALKTLVEEFGIDPRT